MMIIFHDNFEITCILFSYRYPHNLSRYCFLTIQKYIQIHQERNAKILSQNYPHQLEHALLIKVNIYIPALIVISVDSKIAKNII